MIDQFPVKNEEKFTNHKSAQGKQMTEKQVRLLDQNLVGFLAIASRLCSKEFEQGCGIHHGTGNKMFNKDAECINALNLCWRLQIFLANQSEIIHFSMLGLITNNQRLRHQRQLQFALYRFYSSIVFKIFICTIEYIPSFCVNNFGVCYHSVSF